MSPMLEGELPAGSYKFVRDGDRIAYDEPIVRHDKIAQKYRLGTQDNNGYLFVDDGGYISAITPKLVVVDESTTTCKLRNLGNGYRATTIQLVEEKTGQQVKDHF